MTVEAAGEPEPPEQAGVAARDSDLLPPLEDRHTDLTVQRFKRKRDIKVPHPRRWAKVSGVGLRMCPVCRCVVPTVQDGSWHLKDVHDEGRGIEDFDGWQDDIDDDQAELDQARRQFKPLRQHGPAHPMSSSTKILKWVLIGMAAFAVIYILGNLLH